MRARDGCLGRVSLLQRVSVASEVATELARVVYDAPPPHIEPVGPDAAVVPLRVLEDGAVPKLGLERASLTPDADEDGVRRRGTVFSGVMHTITAVIGAGVLTLPSAMATLGYAGGSLALLFAALVTLYTSQLLADLYVINGKRQRTYTGMVKTVMGKQGEIIIGIVQLGNLALTAVAYQVTSGKTLRAIAHSACGVDPVAAAGADVPKCFDSYWQFVLMFGLLQLFLSQAPSLESLAFASVIGAFASFGYSLIALALSIHYLPKGKWLGSAWGQSTDGVWGDLVSGEERRGRWEKEGARGWGPHAGCRVSLAPLSVLCRPSPTHLPLSLSHTVRHGQHPLCLLLLFHADRDPGHAERRRHRARPRAPNEEGRQHLHGHHDRVLLRHLLHRLRRVGQ